MPCPYNFEIKCLWLSSRDPLRDVVLYRIKCRRRIEEPLRPKMRFEFRY